jgi:hypothetical protein
MRIPGEGGVPADPDFSANTTEPQVAEPLVVKLGETGPASGLT